MMKVEDTNGVMWNVATAGEEDSDQVVLLVHGFPLDHTMWEHQLSSLGKHARLIAPDLPGFGRSRFSDSSDSHHPAAGPSMEGWADDLASLLDAMSIDRPVIYCGLSMGGYIGWQFWRRHRARVQAMVCCDTRAAADSVEVARGREMMAAKVRNEGSDFVASAMILKLFANSALEQGTANVAETRSVIDSTDAESIAQGQLAMAGRVDATDWLAEIETPTLLVVGSEDVITTPAEMRGMSDKMSDVAFFEIEGAGHMAPLEQPAAFNQRMEGFLARVAEQG